MTSIANKNAYGAVSASLKLADKSMINKHFTSAMCESGGASAAELQAETIEVVPELPTFAHHGDDSGDEFSEYSDENDMAIAGSHLNNMDDDEDDDDEEPFDEYGKKINWSKLIYYCLIFCVQRRLLMRVCVSVSVQEYACASVSAWL